MAKDKEERNRSWFCVWNNPKEHREEFQSKTPEEICFVLCDEWQKKYGDNCACAVAYCISKDGLEHIHSVLENPNKVSFSKVREFFGNTGHIDPTRGTKKQAEDYINKRGAFEEKGEKILAIVTRGEIQGAQGRRNELEEIDNLIAEGKTPTEIFEICGLMSRRYEDIIKKAYFAKRCKETPRARDVEIYWHLGDSGSGKSYCYASDNRPDDDIILIHSKDFGHSGLWDNYYGQSVLYMDELKPGSCSFSWLLGILDVYRTPLKARYADGFQLWTEVNITSVFTPEEIYRQMIEKADGNSKVDVIEQLHRIKKLTFHFVTDENNVYVENPRGYTGKKNYHSFTIDYKDFISREDLKKKALASVGALECYGGLVQQDLSEFFS